MNLYSQISKNQNKLNENESQLLNQFIGLKETIQELTIRQLAEKYYVAPNTIIRMCKKLEFSGYSEFRNALSSYLVPEANRVPLTRNGILSQLEKSNQLLNVELIETVVDVIHDSYKLALFSSGLSRFITQDLEERFRLLGRKVHSFHEHDLMIHAANRLSEKDCVMVFSVSGETPASIEATRIARLKGAKIISVTGLSNNTMSHLADHTMFVFCDPFLYDGIDMTDRIAFSYVASLIFCRYTEKWS